VSDVVGRTSDGRACYAGAWNNRRPYFICFRVVAGPGAPDAGRGLHLYVSHLHLLPSRLVAHRQPRF
jgi:hypothetical protein